MPTDCEHFFPHSGDGTTRSQLRDPFHSSSALTTTLVDLRNFFDYVTKSASVFEAWLWSLGLPRSRRPNLDE
jgi:hypothetical protein